MRQVVDESQKYQRKNHPEIPSVCKDQQPLYLPGLPNGTTKMLNMASHHTQRRKTRPNPTSLLRIPPKKKPISSAELKKKMDGPMPRGPSRGILQQPKNAIFLIRTIREIPVEVVESDSK